MILRLIANMLERLLIRLRQKEFQSKVSIMYLKHDTELSFGYSLVLDETPGERNGEPYDAMQTGIRINHVAFVDKALDGKDAKK